jgi:methylated-DNA-protein-cysteine methyltransferase-like protein
MPNIRTDVSIFVSRINMDFFSQVYAMVKKIPKGSVATYGQIAALLGKPRAARMVGWALHALDSKPDLHIPWQRVINRKGEISTTCLEHTADEQAYLLAQEGVKVESTKLGHTIDLKKFGWNKGLKTEKR